MFRFLLNLFPRKNQRLAYTSIDSAFFDAVKGKFSTRKKEKEIVTFVTEITKLIDENVCSPKFISGLVIGEHRFVTMEINYKGETFNSSIQSGGTVFNEIPYLTINVIVNNPPMVLGDDYLKDAASADFVLPKSSNLNRDLVGVYGDGTGEKDGRKTIYLEYRYYPGYMANKALGHLIKGINKCSH